MQIRIKQDLQKGPIQFFGGQVLDLPRQLAQVYIDAGEAVAVAKAERATLTAKGQGR